MARGESAATTRKKVDEARKAFEARERARKGVVEKASASAKAAVSKAKSTFKRKSSSSKSIPRPGRDTIAAFEAGIPKGLTDEEEIKKFGKVQEDKTSIFSKEGIKEFAADPIQAIKELAGTENMTPSDYLLALTMSPGFEGVVGGITSKAGATLNKLMGSKKGLAGINVPELTRHFGRVSKPTTQIGKLITTEGISTLGGKVIPIATNTFTEKIIAQLASVKLSRTTLMTLAKGAIGLTAAGLAYVGLIGTGYWAEAEQPEGVTFTVSKFVLPDAIESGDFTLFNEIIAAGDDIMATTGYEEKVAGTPLAYPVEARKKGEMTRLGWEALKQVGADAQEEIVMNAAIESGLNVYNPETGVYTDAEGNKSSIGEAPEGALLTTDTANEEAKWAKIDAREEEQKTLAHQRAIFEIDYFNENAVKTAQTIADIKASGSAEENRDYLKSLEKQIKMNEEYAERIRQSDKEYQIWLGEYWLEYRRLKAEMADDSRPSNLNFGLI